MINCITVPLPPAKSNSISIQLIHGVRGDHVLDIIFSSIFSHITHFANCLIQCRQNTVVFLMGSIQHCILGTIRTLVGFFSHLRTSNTYSRNTDAVMIRGMDDFQKAIPCESTDEMNVSFSNTPASMKTVTSILKNNFNRLYQIFGKSRKHSKTITGRRAHYFFNRIIRNYISASFNLTEKFFIN